MDFSMDELARLLDSVSPEEMQSLQQTAKALFGEQPPAKDEQPPADGIDPAMLQKIGRMMGAMRRGQDERSALIAALTPYLSAPRQKKAQQAMQFLRLLDVLPMLNGM